MRISTITMFNQSLSNMMNSQSRLNHISAQMATQKRLLNPADDPVATSRIRALHDNVRNLETYNKNNLDASNQLAFVENTLDSITDSMLRIDELARRSLAGPVNSSDKKILAQEIEQQLDTIIGTMNAKDAQGNYLFSGSKTDVKPYIKSAGQYTYQGDQSQLKTAIASNITVNTSYSGFSLFENINNGNGYFNTGDGAVNNLGNATVFIGDLNNPAAYVADDYTISFVTNGSGNLAYTVVGASTGQVVPALPDTVPADAPDYNSGESITFNGVEVVIKGTPQVGDDFSVLPSSKQNILDTIQNIIDAIRTPANTEADDAEFQTTMNRHLNAFDGSLDNILFYVTQIGASMHALESQHDITEDLVIHDNESISYLEDLDPIEAVSKLMAERNAMEAAQLAYVRTSDLNLLNYIR